MYVLTSHPNRLKETVQLRGQNFAIIPILPFLKDPKDLDPSYKMDLDLWDCFGRKNSIL